LLPVVLVATSVTPFATCGCIDPLLNSQGEYKGSPYRPQDKVSRNGLRRPWSVWA